jgi:hypothetical protein
MTVLISPIPVEMPGQLEAIALDEGRSILGGRAVGVFSAGQEGDKVLEFGFLIGSASLRKLDACQSDKLPVVWVFAIKGFIFMVVRADNITLYTNIYYAGRKLFVNHEAHRGQGNRMKWFVTNGRSAKSIVVL